MKTKLLEFLNSQNQILRGIVTLPNGKINKAVICIHGFDRCSTTEKKFKKLADSFAKKMTATLRFDFSGCGLSDGDFKSTTIEKQGEELIRAIKAFQNEIGDYKINPIAHSLGACVLAKQIEKIKSQIEKIILIAPALNQRDLLRYWFVSGKMKKLNPEIEITWQNYKDHLNETEFIEDCEKEGKMTKTNYIQPTYFLQEKDFDYSGNFKKYNSNILHIHGLKDNAVPLESINIKFKNQIIIEKGKHDLEKPNQMEQWNPKAVDFL